MEKVKNIGAEDLVRFIGENGDVLHNMLLHAIEGAIHERDTLIKSVKSPKEISNIKKSAKDVISQYIETWAEMDEYWKAASGDVDPLELGVGFGLEIEITDD